MKRSIHPLLAIGLSVAVSSPDRGQASEVEAGPLVHRFALTLTPGAREEAAGPLWYRDTQEARVTYAVPPLFSYTVNPALESEELDILYPFITHDRRGSEYRLQFLQLLNFAGGRDPEQRQAHRFTLFPFVFTQRGAATNHNYTAVVPFGGRMENHLFRDEVKFVLMPLWVQTRKKDVVTDNYLLPLFHVRRGNGLRGWQFWPLFGTEHKEITTRTNVVHEVERVPGHDKFFALWPLVAGEKTGIGTANPVTNRFALPFFYAQRSPQRDATTYLWPLFTVTDDRARQYREYGFPWPLLVFARGEGKTVNRVFPVYSHAYSTNLESLYYGWPVYMRHRFHDTALERERRRVFYFLYSDVTVKLPGEKTGKRRTDLWPLFTARRDEAGNERLQLLAPLEPVVPENTPVERNLSPVWSIWRHEKNGKTGVSSQSLLWNLYRHEKGPETKKVSFLFGLFRYQASAGGRQWRVFYIPFGSARGAAAPPAAQK